MALSHEYKVVSRTVSTVGAASSFTNEFDEAVSKLCKEGWEPHGSMVAIPTSAGFFKFCQPMTRTTETLAS